MLGPEIDRPHIVAGVQFYSSTEGGRHGPIFGTKVFKCVFTFHGDNFDCVLLLQNIGSIHPGQTVTVPMLFLCPDLLEGRLHPGDVFQLREARIIAEGKVESVFLPNRETNSLDSE